MLTVTSSLALGAAFDARPAVANALTATRAPAASMVLGLFKGKEEKTTALDITKVTGAVVPTGGPVRMKAVVSAVVGAETPTFEALQVPAPKSTKFDWETYDTSSQELTQLEVIKAQANWANAITTISRVYLDGGDFVGAAGTAAGELYGYGHTDVLFKPTKATKHPFRPTGEDAMSYFVGSEAMGNDKFTGEDAGFAINGGKGWSSVVFRNHNIEMMGDSAIAMGDYIFTDATSGDEVRVEYTFGYKKCADGKPRIFLHHSSVPYSAGPAAPAGVTEMDVLQVQANWANAIKTISSIHKEGGDYIQAAANAAGELYAYGHDNVLFKPTKAKDFQFRPTGEDAMSYFVGGNVVDNGYDEDAGFAINGGKGWANCVYDNHQVVIKNGVGIAMGNYYFTCATTGDEVKVEYTFGYQRCTDGKVRIFLHHSSVPYAA